MRQKAYTNKQVRELFLKQVWSYIDYWETIEDSPNRDRLSGLAFSLLVTLDGGTIDLPGFIVAPNPHQDDKDYCKKKRKNWFPMPPVVPSDIGGQLHENFYKFGSKS